VFNVFQKHFIPEKYIYIQIHYSYCFIFVCSHRALNLRLSTNCVPTSVKTKIKFSRLFSSRPVKRTYLFRNCRKYCSIAARSNLVYDGNNNTLYVPFIRCVCCNRPMPNSISLTSPLYALVIKVHCWKMNDYDQYNLSNIIISSNNIVVFLETFVCLNSYKNRCNTSLV